MQKFSLDAIAREQAKRASAAAQRHTPSVVYQDIDSAPTTLVAAR